MRGTGSQCALPMCGHPDPKLPRPTVSTSTCDPSILSQPLSAQRSDLRSASVCQINFVVRFRVIGSKKPYSLARVLGTAASSPDSSTTQFPCWRSRKRRTRCCNFGSSATVAVTARRSEPQSPDEWSATCQRFADNSSALPHTQDVSSPTLAH